jgi:thiol:disulfide interchange protein DsbD
MIPSRLLTTYRLATALAFAVGLLLCANSASTIEVPDPSRAKAAVDDGDPRVEGRLLLDHSRVQPGDPFKLGILFDLDPKWHLYWKNPGEAGLAPQISWSGEGVETGPVLWPSPKPFLESGGEVLTYGYADRILLWANAKIPETTNNSEKRTIRASIDFLTCKVDCIPGHLELERTIEIGSRKRNKTEGRLFEHFAKRLPKSPKDLGIEPTVALSQRPIRPGEQFKTAIHLEYCTTPGKPSCDEAAVISRVQRGTFMPTSTEPIDWRTLRISNTADNKQTIYLRGQASPDLKTDTGYQLEGLLKLRLDDGSTHTLLIEHKLETAEADAAVERVSSRYFEPSDGEPETVEESVSSTKTGTKSAQTPKAPDLSVFYILLLAFVGGMLLNIMPCVFPVLALKVTAFAKIVHESRRQIYAHAGAYTLGIVASMCALATVVVGLRYAGIGVGWGFQFQQPLFIVVLSAILIIFALNLFDVFQISVDADSLSDRAEEATGLRRSFLEGILAVILATPCSAPFLGTAVGFALTGSTPAIFGVFATIGLGLAFPFVLLVSVPGWQNYLPSPGQWMAIVKELLGFILLGTTIWLLWILGQTTGATGIIWTLVFLTGVAAGTWLFGRLQYSVSQRQRFVLIAGLLLSAGLLGNWTLRFETDKISSEQAAEATSSESGISWQTWSDQTVHETLSNGRPVFVDFTADWCITCKVNERTVINTPKIKKAVERHDVAMFKADWTQRNERIRKKLAEFGKAGVPMYLFYRPENPGKPEVLSENLTQEALLSAFQGGTPDK